MGPRKPELLMTDAEKLMRRSLDALFIQCPEAVAQDVKKNVLAAYEELREQVKREYGQEFGPSWKAQAESLRTRAERAEHEKQGEFERADAMRIRAERAERQIQTAKEELALEVRKAFLNCPTGGDVVADMLNVVDPHIRDREARARHAMYVTLKTCNCYNEGYSCAKCDAAVDELLAAAKPKTRVP
jgi:hypothetical protein